jgi:hypothetical protein
VRRAAVFESTVAAEGSRCKGKFAAMRWFMWIFSMMMILMLLLKIYH